MSGYMCPVKSYLMSLVEKQNLRISCASGLLRMCSQVEGSEGSRIEQRKTAKPECGGR